MKINSDMIKKMHQEAEKVYGPDLVRVVKIQNNLALASCKPFDLKTSSLEKKKS